MQFKWFKYMLYRLKIIKIYMEAHSNKLYYECSICFFKILLLWHFRPSFSLDMKGEREGTTCSKGPQVGIEHAAAAARTEPQYMGCMCYQVS